jgi:hypothetical protein
LKNNNKKQTFKTDGILFMLALLLATGLALRPLWSPQENEKISQAKARAESLGYQLLQMQANLNQPTAGSRGPASVANEASSGLIFKDEGQIGTDPWGQPYSYRVLKSETDSSQRVEVWSSHMTDMIKISSKLPVQ